jgi:hypothetical protein
MKVKGIIVCSYFEVLFWCRHGINMHHTLRIVTLERDKITNIHDQGN